jgi:2-polyprenyl-3-methyl-5-hydroxy-6-metoxy-1,4-benzoquinol methylase
MFPEKIAKEKNSIFSGEREIGTKLEDFSSDHVNRYNFAKYFMRKGYIVLDAACGVGYGSHLLAGRALKVDAIDYNADAIEYAKAHWQKENIRYIQGSLLDQSVYPKGQKYHAIVSFETIEHLKDDNAFLRVACERLLPDGMVFISAPNSRLVRAEDNPWHERHYTPEEFTALLSKYFRYIFEFTQIDCGIRKGRGGDNNILVCSNKPWFNIRVWIFLTRKFLYRLRRRVVRSLQGIS